MARELRQSTSVDLPIGPFVDQTDGFTAETALTITQPDIRLKKNAANWAQKNAAQTLTHEENGYYEVTLDTTDTNTLGQLRLAVNEAGALPIFEDFMVVTAEYWDAKYAGTGNGIRADVRTLAGSAISQAAGVIDANVLQISGDATAADNCESYFDGTGYHDLLQRTTIATLASQTDFTLTAGSADNDAYNGCEIIFEDSATLAQKAVGIIDDYVGSTKQVLLRANPGIYTVAATDKVTIKASRSLQPTVPIRTLDVSATGEAGLDWANIGGASTTQNLSATTIKTATDIQSDTDDIQARLPAALVGGRIDANVGAINNNTTARDNLQAMFDGNGYAGGTTKLGTNLVQWKGTAPADLISTRVDVTVGAMQADVVTAGAIAADAIGSSELATTAINEIRDAVLAGVVEAQGSYTVAQTLSICLSLLAGRTSAGTFKTPDNNATRAVFTYSGNDRNSVTLTP